MRGGGIGETRSRIWNEGMVEPSDQGVNMKSQSCGQKFFSICSFPPVKSPQIFTDRVQSSSLRWNLTFHFLGPGLLKQRLVLSIAIDLKHKQTREMRDMGHSVGANEMLFAWTPR